MKLSILDCSFLRMGICSYLLRPIPNSGVMSYITAFFLLSGGILVASHMMRIVFVVPFLDVRRILGRGRSGFVLGRSLVSVGYFAGLFGPSGCLGMG